MFRHILKAILPAVIMGCTPQSPTPDTILEIPLRPLEGAVHTLPDETKETQILNAKFFWLTNTECDYVAVPTGRVFILSMPNGHLAAMRLVSNDENGASFEWLLQQEETSDGAVSLVEGRQRVFENYDYRPLTEHEKKRFIMWNRDPPDEMVVDKGSQTSLLVGGMSIEWSFPNYLYLPGGVGFHITETNDLDGMSAVLREATPDSLEQLLRKAEL